MNKKIKWAIPFAVLALTCGITAAGCNGCNKHEHSYTEWGYNETQHWKQCPEDDEIDQSTKEDHEFVDGSCECGATQQTPPVTDVTITNETTDTNGTVTLSKTTVKAGESVTVTVAPNEGYQLKSLTVNGANVFGAMTDNTYTFTAQENTTVVAVFEKIASSSVNSVITGKKYGVTGNSLTAGTTVTLSAEGRDDIATEIKADGDNLFIKVDEIAGDNWAVKVEGYVAATIIVPRDAAYTSAIALEYDLMENLSTSWGNYDGVDLSKQNDGKITHTGGYYQWVSSKDSYESVAITANVVKGGYRQGVFIRFKGDTYADDGFAMVAKEENSNEKKISVCGAGDGYTGKNLWLNNWDTYLNPITKDECELTLVRDGANIYIFIDGEYKATKALPEGYADKECYVGLFCTDATKMENSERTFAIQDASEFLEISVTDETTAGAHGTVTIDKPTANLNERVTVTLEPENGYKISDLKIDGVSVLSQMTGNSYTFTALKDTTVVAEFEEKKPLNSLEVTVNAANGFTAEGAKITLEQLGEKQTGTVGANGKLTLGSAEKPVATGTHNVYADFGGYQIKLGTVNVEASDNNAGTAKPVSVTLGFTGSSDGNIAYAEAVSSANPATGELTFKLGKADNSEYNNKYDIVDIENGGYFATKIKFNDIGENKRSLSLILLVQKPDGTTKEIKYVIQNANRFFGEDGKFYMNLDDDSIGGGNGAFDKNNAVNIDKYSAALKGDGLWLVLGYNAETGGLVTYAGTELASVRPVKTWGTLPAGLKITDIGVGNWFGDKNQAYGGNSDTATVTFKYGKTMADIGMAIEEKVTVTASVNNEAMGTVALDSTDGKYFSYTQVNVTVTANAGYVLKSITVGDEAVTEGWTTDGNVYTYAFTVSANTTVVATFEELEVWESATLTLNGVTENTEVKLYDGVDTITAIAGANGVVTLTGENQIGKKVYTVTVKNIVFNVDFTTESSIRKTIATVTVDDFKAKDNYNEGAKVIDMGGAKNSTEYAVTFNLKTTSTIEGWKQRWSLLLINGDDSKTTGIGCIGKNDDQLLVWAANGASPDDKNPTKYGEAKYLKFDELVHGANGVNMKVVRHGSKATMYFELEDEWIEMLTVTLGSGETNLKFACSFGVEWQISDMAINYVSEFDYLVNASIEGDAHGYKVKVEQTANAATVVIQTNDAKAAWSYFPNAITVNGTAIGFSTVTKESLGANRCKYTFTLNITENTDIVVTVGKGTQVGYSASVNDGTMGNVVCDMEDKNKEYYWNDECTFTVTAKEGYELESIVIDEGEDAITVTADGTNKWTQNGKVYTYSYLVTGDIKVVANFKETTLADVTLTVAAKDWDGTEITLEAGTQINFASVTSGQTYTYTVGGDEVSMQVGTYTVTCAGFCTTKVTIGQDGAVTVNLAKPIATSTSNEIAVNEDKTITIHGNGIADRTSDRAISADLKLTDEQKRATGLTLTFTVKGTKKDNRGGDDWAASRFGVQLGEGALGFFVFARNNSAPTAADIVKLPENSLGMNGVEHKWHGDDPALAWLTAAAFSENGLQMKVERKNGVISVYAKNGENWVLLSKDEQNKDNGGTANEAPSSGGDLTIANNVLNEIKFLGCGDHWTFSDISVTLPAESEKATLTTSVNDKTLGNIETDVANYYKGDKAIITVTVNQGYVLEKLVIGETEVLASECTKNGLEYIYEYTLTGDTTVVAYIIETPTPQVTPNVTVSGGKYGSTEIPTVAEGTTVTLTNAEMETEYVGTVGADGKLTFDKELYVATYKVSAEGYFDGEITITENVTEPIELKLYVETVDCEITVGETGDTAKFVAEGAQLTFTKDSVTKTATVTDGKVKLTGVLTGNWKTTANFGGYELDLGWTTVDKSGAANITVDASGIMWSKKEKDIVSSNIAGGTVEIITNQAYHNKITLATAVEGGAMAFKFALPDSVKAKLQGDGDVNATVTMPVGNNGGSLWVIIHIEKSGENKKIQFAYYDKVDGGNWFDESKRLDLSAQWDTLVAGGLWVVVDLNKDTGALTTYVGATLETATAQDYARTCTLANKSIDKIEIGNALDAATDNLLVTFRYGATVQDLGIGSTPAGNE